MDLIADLFFVKAIEPEPLKRFSVDRGSTAGSVMRSQHSPYDYPALPRLLQPISSHHTKKPDTLRHHTSSSKKLPSFRADAAADAALAVASSASADATLATFCATAAAATASLAANSAVSTSRFSSPVNDDTARCDDRDLAVARKHER